MRKVQSILSCLLLCASATVAQTASTSNAAEALKLHDKIFKLGPGHDITVHVKHGATYHGQILRIDDADFEIREVDLKQSVRWYYSEVKNVRGDYGPQNAFGKRINPKTSKIIMFSVMGGLFAFLIAVVPKT